MKKVVLLFASILVWTACNSVKETASTEVKSEIYIPMTKHDSVSYAVGVSMFNGSQQLGLDLDYEVLVKGFMAASDCTAVVPVSIANLYLAQAVQEQQALDLIKYKEDGAKFLEKNREAEGVIETASGLQYKVIKKGEGPFPGPDSRVLCNYTGYLLDGTIFDTTKGRGPLKFILSNVIDGWTEAVQLMQVGSEFVIYVPSELAYGDQGAGEKIKPGSTLIFEIELLEIDAL